MQRPPRLPPILESRPAHDWINRVNARAREFAALVPSPGGDESSEFVTATLALDGVSVTEGQARAILENPESPYPASRAVRSALKSLDLARRAAERGDAVPLTVNLIRQFAASFGDSDDPFRSGHPRILPVLESACDWFEAESFRELHPVEQAAIVYLRLLEIDPFADYKFTASLVAASLFTLRAGLPAVVIAEGRRAAHDAAIAEARRMNTRPAVEFFAECIEGTLIRMIEPARKSSEGSV